LLAAQGERAVVASTRGDPVFGLPVRFQRAELLNHADLSAAGRALVDEARGPEDLVDMLQASANRRDLLATLALILPKRQAAWWACLAARLLAPAAGSPELAAINAAEAWVQTQGDEDRFRAEAAADALDHDGAAAWAALAAFWSGGSIGPRDSAPVPPAPHLTGTAVRAALFMTAAARPSAWSELVEIGLEILAGGSGRTAFDRTLAAAPAEADA
jgi:hypothetical protein